MEKRYLFTPGPTPVPPAVLAAMAEPIVHHRGPDFRLVYERALSRLQEVFRTRSQVLLFAVIVSVNAAWLLSGAALTRFFRDPRTNRAINVTFAILLIASVAFALLV